MMVSGTATFSFISTVQMHKRIGVSCFFFNYLCDESLTYQMALEDVLE